jgi:glycosyltransferase involved in cell wall biosynthesis
VTADYRLIQLKTANYNSIEKIDGITVYRYPYLTFRNRSAPIVSLPMLSFNVSDCDVIHLQGLNMTSSFTLLSLLIKLKGRKFIATTHGIAEFSGRPKSEIFSVLNLYLKKAERIIALCDYESKTLNRLGIPKEKITIIPNGVDLTRFNHKPTY